MSEINSSCESTWPEGQPEPVITQSFPERAQAGHLVELTFEISHGRGETIFPAGLRLSQQDGFIEVLDQAGFSLFEKDSPHQPLLSASSTDQGTLTQVVLPVLALPKTAGRHELTLPALPVSISRASGSLYTICTKSHRLIVEDALVQETQPELQADPEGRVQLEVWESAYQLTQALLIALPLGILFFALFYFAKRLLKRPPPPAPVIPPWTVALARLDNLGSVPDEVDKLEAYFDECTDILRWYLGSRYGFDGLESTTQELLAELEKRARYDDILPGIMSLLAEVDLVKFAGSEPTWQQCDLAQEKTRQIILKTKPRDMPSLSQAALSKGTQQ